MSSTPKKYLSLEETAERLNVPKDELIRMREKGEIRGFADRGTWKFRVDDVEEVVRTRQADSAPDVPLMEDDAVDETDLGEQPTVIRKSDEVSAGSDSDVRIVSDEPVGGDSDSDVKLVGGDSSGEVTLMPGDEEEGSDSDVKLVDTDSDISAKSDEDSSDSDVKLVADADAEGSDSDVQLIDAGEAESDSSDSDVALVSESDSAVALDVAPEDSEQASVLSEDVGLATEEESSLTLAADSGISLEGDSGITLEGGDSGISADDDEGITLEASDSGISLESVSDSGISLEDSDEFSGTVPMMEAAQADETEETRFEIPSMEDDSGFDLEADVDETSELSAEDAEAAALDDAVFDIDEETDAFGEEDDLEVAADILGEDDELDELEVFDADEGLFEESGASQEFAAPAAREVAVEQEWGAGLVAGLAVSAVVMLFATIISFDLVRSMWGSPEVRPFTSMFFE